MVTITRSGYIKRTHVEAYRSQKRGGKGVTGMETKEEDIVEDLFVASTHSYLLFFTNQGKVHWLKVHEIPEGGRQAKGKAMVNVLSLAEGERGGHLRAGAGLRVRRLHPASPPSRAR